MVGSNIFGIFTPNLWEDSHFDSYFSKGVETTNEICIRMEYDSKLGKTKGGTIKSIKPKTISNNCFIHFPIGSMRLVYLPTFRYEFYGKKWMFPKIGGFDPKMDGLFH